MESQKHRNVLAESKEAMLKKKPNSEEIQEDLDNVPISKLLHHPLEETQEEDAGDVPISKSLHHPLEETQEEDAGNVPISKLLHHPSMIKWCPSGNSDNRCKKSSTSTQIRNWQQTNTMQKIVHFNSNSKSAADEHDLFGAQDISNDQKPIGKSD